MSVNLAGGPSRVASFHSADGDVVEFVDADEDILERATRAYPAAPTGETSEIAGIVVDGGGVPVAGAIVLSGNILIDRAHDDEPHASAADGALTDEDGRFVLRSQRDAVVLAMTPGCVSALAHADASTKLALTMDCTTEVRGRILRAGEPMAGSVRLELAEPERLAIRVATTPDGAFSVTPVPPGEYLALASVTAPTDDIHGPETAASISVAAGQITERDLHIGEGTLVAISALLPARLGGLHFVSHVLIDGTHQVSDAADLERLQETLDESSIAAYSFGGDAATARLDRTSQFDEVTAGPHTACAQLDEHAPVCRVLHVRDGESLLEVQLPLTAETRDRAPRD